MCTFFNRAWLEFRGRQLDEEMGNGWTEGLHPDDRDLCLETYLKAFTARQPFRVQYRMQKANGEYSWVEDHGIPRVREGCFDGLHGHRRRCQRPPPARVRPDEQSVRMVFSLTERERQVLVLIADGKSTKEAAHPGHQLQDGRFPPQPHSGKTGRPRNRQHGPLRNSRRTD